MWEKTRGDVKAVGTMSNGAITLYTINPNVKTIANFTDRDRIAVPNDVPGPPSTYRHVNIAVNPSTPSKAASRA